MTLKNEKNVDIQVISPGPKGSLSIRPSYGVRGEEIFFFPFSPETPDTQANQKGNFIYPMMHRFILYYQSFRTHMILSVQQERDS